VKTSNLTQWQSIRNGNGVLRKGNGDVFMGELFPASHPLLRGTYIALSVRAGHVYRRLIHKQMVHGNVTSVAFHSETKAI
jgi:hypothetical protein